MLGQKASCCGSIKTDQDATDSHPGAKYGRFPNRATYILKLDSRSDPIDRDANDAEFTEFVNSCIVSGREL